MINTDKNCLFIRLVYEFMSTNVILLIRSVSMGEPKKRPRTERNFPLIKIKSFLKSCLKQCRFILNILEEFFHVIIFIPWTEYREERLYV